MNDEREVVQAGPVEPISWKHLYPIARFLVEERGHLPLYNPEKWGLSGSPVSFQFSRRITEADWEAINRRFVIPDNIVYYAPKGWIQDNVNRVYFEGNDKIIGLDGVEPIEIWEAEERALDRTYGRPGIGEGKAGPVPSE
jgi:hypothetical protein